MSEKPVVSPNLGIYYDRPKIAMSTRMLSDGHNFRIKDGKLQNLNLGWEPFSAITLNGAVLKIDNFFVDSATEKLIFITKTDIYSYDAVGDTVSFVTPVYNTGTASRSGTSVTGTGTDWDPNVKAGDQISFGSSSQTNPSATWFTILSRNSDTSLTLTSGTGSNANGPYTIRKLFSGDDGDHWVTDIFIFADPSGENEWWATNGVDNPVRWNGLSAHAELMSSLSFTSCKSLAVYSNMMIFGNIVQVGAEKPTDIVNSNVGQPQETGAGLSEQFRTYAGHDEILRTVQLADTLVIYGEQTIALALFVGDPLVFVFRTVVTGHGPVGAYAIADFGSYHEFLSHDTLYRFDGVTIKEVAQHYMREVLRSQDPVRTPSTYSHFDIENGEVLWSVPSLDDPATGTIGQPPSIVHTEHYLENVGPNTPIPFSRRDFPFTATGFFTRQTGLTWNQLTERWNDLNFRWNDQFFSASFPLNIAGDANGNLWTFNTTQTANGTDLPSFIKFGKRPIGNGQMRGLLTRVYPFVTPFDNTLDITIHMSDHAGGIATITDTKAFDQNLTEGNYFSVFYRRGRYTELEFGTDGGPWELSGYDIDLRPGGFR